MNDLRRLPPGKYRLTVDDYERLAEADAFGGQRTELIEGDVIVMSPQFRPHGMVKLGLYDALRDHLRRIDSLLVPVVEFSLALDLHSMPDPDITLTTEPRGDKAVPLASVALIIEVSDTTLRKDLGIKQRLYAGGGIPEYWVADVNRRVIHRMWSPAGDTYAERDDHPFGAPIRAATIAGLEVATATL